MKELDLDRNPPQGALFHVATMLPTGIRVVDLWESAETFERFSQSRIMPAAAKVGGITTQPKIEIHPVHNVYVPGASAITAMGASSLPR